jgi:DNA-binding NarL/FixJ family response regulator
MDHPLEKSMTHPGKNDKLRTLIVEDNDFFRQSFKERLEELFPVMDIREAATAREALEKAKAFNPELIFMDIRLPDGNGLDVTKKIKADNPNVAVIILTNYDLPEYREAALQIGAKTYLNKNSFSWEEVERWVKSMG